jgi:hypothetical protein
VSLLQKSRRGALIAGSVCALGLGGVAFAVPASASASDITCNVWSDSQTAGATCWGEQTIIDIVVMCQDGFEIAGPEVPTNSGQWSYGYCAGNGGLAGFFVEEWPP